MECWNNGSEHQKQSPALALTALCDRPASSRLVRVEQGNQAFLS